MRRYIRHPSDIPIAYDVERCSQFHKASLKNAGKGGVAFRTSTYIKPESAITIHIPEVNPPIKLHGHVVWCRKRKDHYDIGVKFPDDESTFRVRMIEQVCSIEHYKNEVLKKEGRKLSGEEAAHEWIERYAKDFPGLK